MIDSNPKKLYHVPFMLNRILIDTQTFAEQKETLHGSLTLQDLDERLAHADLADTSTQLAYRISGGTDNLQRPYLQLALSGSLKLFCQRCLKPTDFALDENVRIVLFDNEEDLDRAMLADEELEGMLYEAQTDVFALIEDQILMALPFAPRHETCGAADVQPANQNKPNPFAVLAGLKKTD